MSAAATAPGYWRICNSLGDFPSNPSRPSSTYSSSRRTFIKDGDHRSMAVAETAERTARGRTSRRQRFVLASVGEVLRRFVPSRGAGPERADAGERMGDFVSGDFRREGMGAPGIGDTPPHLTASRPVPALPPWSCASSWAFSRRIWNESNRFRVFDTQNVIGREAATRARPRTGG